MVINGIVIGKVMYNRSSETASVVLTERELVLSRHANAENSGFSLRLNFRTLDSEVKHYVGASHYPDWLDKPKMLALGFSADDLEVSEDQEYKRKLGKQVYLAVEYDGDAYQQMVRQVANWYTQQMEQGENSENNTQRALKRVKRENIQASRLFVIDADLDLDVLMQKYPSQNNIFWVRGIISPLNSWDGAKNTKAAGYIDSLSISQIHIPKPLNQKLRQLERVKFNEINSPRYEIELKYGKNLEPWVTDVTLID